MFSLSPFGIVKTEPDCTITLAGAVDVEVSVQLEDNVQSPEAGGVHETVYVDETELFLLSVAAIVC